jgi:hypothetical protein
MYGCLEPGQDVVGRAEGRVDRVVVLQLFHDVVFNLEPFINVVLIYSYFLKVAPNAWHKHDRMHGKKCIAKCMAKSAWLNCFRLS